MAVDDRKRAPGQHGADGSTPDPAGVVLPEHASAYFSPRSPPVATSHQTLETEAVRLDPAIDPDEAPTQPVKIGGLPPPPWLGAPLQSDSPTLLLPLIVERRRRRRFVAAIAAALVGVLAGVVYGFTRPLSRETGSVGSPEPPRQHGEPSTAGSGPHPSAGGPDGPSVAQAPSPMPPEAPAEPAATDTLQATGAHRPPTGSGAKGPRPSVPSGTPSAWLKSEPPKPWFK